MVEFGYQFFSKLRSTNFKFEPWGGRIKGTKGLKKSSCVCILDGN